MVSLERLDQDLTLALNALHTPFTDKMWIFFSTQEVWYLLYLAVAVEIFLNFGWKKGLVLALSIGAVILCCDQLANLFKDGFCRLRPMFDPYMLDNGVVVLGEKGGLYGFFSAHSANSFGFAVASSVILNKKRYRRYRVYTVVILIWALMVALSRVFLAKHFIGDIFVGMIFGVLFGYLFSKIALKIIS